MCTNHQRAGCEHKDSVWSSLPHPTTPTQLTTSSICHKCVTAQAGQTQAPSPTDTWGFHKPPKVRGRLGHVNIPLTSGDIRKHMTQSRASLGSRQKFHHVQHKSGDQN